MAYSNLFNLCFYLLQKNSYSSFPIATLFLSHDTFFVANSKKTSKFGSVPKCIYNVSSLTLFAPFGGKINTTDFKCEQCELPYKVFNTFIWIVPLTAAASFQNKSIDSMVQTFTLWRRPPPQRIPKGGRTAEYFRNSINSLTLSAKSWSY